MDAICYGTCHLNSPERNTLAWLAHANTRQRNGDQPAHTRANTSSPLHYPCLPSNLRRGSNASKCGRQCPGRHRHHMRQPQLGMPKCRYPRRRPPQHMNGQTSLPSPIREQYQLQARAQVCRSLSLHKCTSEQLAYESVHWMDTPRKPN